VSDGSTGIFAKADLTVGAAEIAALSITAPSSSLALGLNQTLSLTGTFSDNTTSTSLTGVQWTSSDATKASVASNGLVTSLAQGTVKLTATVGGVSKDFVVTVTDPVTKELTVSSALSTIVSGASTTLNALAKLTNDAVVAVAKLVNWTVESLGGSAVIAIDGDTVRLTGGQSGDVKVTGAYQGIFANFRLSVTPSLSGVAAVGAPLSGAKMTLTDSRGVQKTTTADDQGNFAFTDLDGMVAPYQIMAVMSLGDRTVSHYSLVASVSGAQTANVTQLTSAMAALLNSDAGVLTSLTNEQLAALTPDAINQAKQKILNSIKPLTDKIVTGSFDPVTTPFVANGTGADLLLDHLDLTVRSDKISLSNKMAVTDSNSLSTAIGVVPKSGDAIPIQDDSTTSTSGFELLQQAFETCFKQAATVRMVASSSTSATLAPACEAIATPDYLHNGQNFKLRWARAFKFEKFNANSPSIFESRKTTKFLRPEVRLRVSTSPEVIAVNIHFNDTDGNNYTSPELIKKMPDGSWKLYGNQRGVNAFVESQLNYYQDLSKAPAGSNYNNINFSRIDSGFRFFVDPRTVFDSQGVADYSYVVDYTTSTGYKPNTAATYAAVLSAIAADSSKSILKCVVVAGPGKFDSSGNKWMGMYPHGIIMKVPFSSPTQDYVAIDRRMSSQEKQALDAINMGLPLSSRSVSSGICGSNTSQTVPYPTTTTSSSNYTVEIQVLTNQVHPFTGQIDAAINGRDVKWNTGSRYARIAPDTALAKEFDNNPVFTYYLIDSNNKLVQKINARMLGELPPVALASEIMGKKLSSQMDVSTLKRYLDFDAGGADVSNGVTSVNAQWTTEANAFGADLIGFYSEIQKSKTGQGLRSKSGANPQSIYPASRDNGSGSVVGYLNGAYTETTLWESDADLAVDLDALPGVNFFWRWSEFARSLNTGATTCNATNAPSANTLVTSQSVGVARSTLQLSSSPLTSRFYGTSQLNSACLDWYSPSRPADRAYLHREVWMRTYTDKNVRFYSYTANKAFR